jgi:hypothetical protein
MDSIESIIREIVRDKLKKAARPPQAPERLTPEPPYRMYSVATAAKVMEVSPIDEALSVSVVSMLRG